MGNGQPKGRPAFVGKLWQMVNDPANDPYIRWMPDGRSIQVVNRELFEKTLLPKYFKHANFSSFVRQLNMYGWHKVQDLSSGSMQSNEENWQFQSPNFVRGHEELLDNIVRNKGTSKHPDDEDEHPDMSKVLRELEAVKNKQMIIGEDLFRMRKDNELLWNEYQDTRNKYEKHSQLLDKILQFLGNVYGQNVDGNKIMDSSFTAPVPPGKRRFITPVPGGTYDTDGAQIQEIQKMRDMQDRIKEATNSSASSSPIDSSPQGQLNHALVPFNQYKPMPKTLPQDGSAVPIPHTPVVPTTAQAQAQVAHAAHANQNQQLAGQNDFGVKLGQNNEDIDNLASQLSLQDLSLQQVQDWISKMDNNDSLNDDSFDVNDFLNSDLDDQSPAPQVKQEDLSI